MLAKFQIEEFLRDKGSVSTNRVNYFISKNKNSLIKNIPVLIEKYGYEETIVYISEANTRVISYLFENQSLLEMVNSCKEKHYTFDHNDYISNKIVSDLKKYSFVDHEKVKVLNVYK